MNHKTEYEIRIENLKAERAMALSSNSKLRLLWIDGEIKKLHEEHKKQVENENQMD